MIGVNWKMKLVKHILQQCSSMKSSVVQGCCSILTAFTAYLGSSLLQLIAGQNFTFMSVEHTEQGANT